MLMAMKQKFHMSDTCTFYRKDNIGIIPSIVSDLIELRKQTGNPIYKNLVNSIYGCFGYPGSIIFDIDNASSITTVAKNIVMRVIKKFELNDKMIYGFADSFFIKGEDESEKYNEYISHIMNKMYNVNKTNVKLVVKDVSNYIYIKSKQDYICLTENGEWIVKGSRLNKNEFSQKVKKLTQDIVIDILYNGKDKEKVFAEYYKKYKLFNIEDVCCVRKKSGTTLDEAIKAHNGAIDHFGLKIEKIKYDYAGKLKIYYYGNDELFACLDTSNKYFKLYFGVDFKANYNNFVVKDVEKFIS